LHRTKTSALTISFEFVRIFDGCANVFNSQYVIFT
jgi:hypothetical protein